MCIRDRLYVDKKNDEYDIEMMSKCKAYLETSIDMGVGSAGSAGSADSANTATTISKYRSAPILYKARTQNTSVIRSTNESNTAPHFDDLPETIARVPSTPSQVNDRTNKTGAHIDLAFK